MRLPFIQLDSDFIRHGAPALGLELDVPTPHALGLASMLWEWAASKDGDDVPPSGIVTGKNAAAHIERAAGWTGEKGRCVAAMLEPTVGLLEAIPDGFRVRGLDRYREAWEKQQKERQRWHQRRSGSTPSCSGGAPVEPHRSTDGNTQIQTHTQTQVQVAASAAPLVGVEEADTTQHAEARPPLVLTQPGTPARKPREPSAAERLYAGLEEARRERCERERLDFIPEGWPPARVNKQLGPLAKATGAEAERLNDAFAEFLADARGVDFDPPWSLGMFLVRRSQYESKAVRAAGGAP